MRQLNVGWGAEMTTPSEIWISIPYTLPIYAAAKAGSEPLFVSEFDCIIEIAAAEYETNCWDWEVRGVTCDGPKPITIYPNTDPHFWSVIERGLKAEAKRIDAMIEDRINWREAA